MAARLLGIRISAIIIATLLIQGCSTVTLQPATQDQLAQLAQANRAASQQAVEPLDSDLTLAEAIARGLKYNLDRRIRSMEEALSLKEWQLSRLDMLPKLVGNAGYNYRNKENITNSEDSVTGEPSLANPSISSERIHKTSSLGLSWSVLDFGLSYYNAKQNANRLLIARERRTKAMHSLIQQIREKFWRAVSAQKLRHSIQETIEQAELGLQQAEKSEQERLRPPLESLRYQRQLLENLRLLETINHQLETSYIELAQLINIPLSDGFRVVEPDGGLNRDILDADISALEDVAIVQNTDIREKFYAERIAVMEARKSLIRLFPALTFDYNIRHSTDEYLINQSWSDAGIKLSYNLIKAFSIKPQKEMSEASIDLAKEKQIATLMAVLTQVHLGRLQYANAIRQYDRANRIAMVDKKIAEHIRHQTESEKQSLLEQISNQTASILSEVRRYKALAEAHASASRLQASLGLQPEIGDLESISLQELTSSVKQSLDKWRSTQTKTDLAPASESAG